MVAVSNDKPENSPGHASEKIDPGNHVILKVAEGEYLYIGHIQQNSSPLKVGDVVKPGEMIGRVGNSGRTSEPCIFTCKTRRCLP